MVFPTVLGSKIATEFLGLHGYHTEHFKLDAIELVKASPPGHLSENRRPFGKVTQLWEMDNFWMFYLFKMVASIALLHYHGVHIRLFVRFIFIYHRVNLGKDSSVLASKREKHAEK